MKDLEDVRKMCITLTCRLLRFVVVLCYDEHCMKYAQFFSTYQSKGTYTYDITGARPRWWYVVLADCENPLEMLWLNNYTVRT